MKSLSDCVFADLQRGMRLMVEVQNELDPQFRFATPYGDVALGVTFPSHIYRRRVLFDRIRQFAAWKQALAYTMTFNLAEPQALMTVGVSGSEAIGCLVRFRGEAGNFSRDSFLEAGWVPREVIDDELLSLLPARASELTENDLRDLEAWFGSEGHFPAVHVPSGGVGL